MKQIQFLYWKKKQNKQTNKQKKPTTILHFLTQPVRLKVFSAMAPNNPWTGTHNTGTANHLMGDLVHIISLSLYIPPEYQNT